MLRRSAYLGYYLRQMDWPLLSKFVEYVRVEHGISMSSQVFSMLRDSLRFNVSPIEYFQFRFFELTEREKATWAGTGTMYEYQRIANPPSARELLCDKRTFYREYSDLFRHELYSLDDLRARPEVLKVLLELNDKLVFKDARGNCGTGITIELVKGKSPSEILSFMQGQKFDVIETFISQHPEMDALSPSGVNTVRIITQLDSAGDCRLLGCRLRVSIDSPVDNLAAGNIAAPIDENTGIVNGPGVFADITRKPVNRHPRTSTCLIGFQIPFWKETLDMVRIAAARRTENRSIGWDIAITESGPGLVEGNHDWCKLVWQLPVNRGLKHLLDLG